MFEFRVRMDPFSVEENSDLGEAENFVYSSRYAEILGSIESAAEPPYVYLNGYQS